MAGISSVGALARRVGYREQIAAAVVVGLVIRVAWAIGDDVMTNDATAYLRSGESLWAGQGFRRGGHPELHFPPLYPAIVGGARWLLGDPHRATVATTLVWSTGLLLLVASLARRLGGDRAAVAAVWIAALATGLSDVPVTAGSGNEVVFLFLVLAATRLALLAHDRTGVGRHAAALASGLMIGGAYLTRPEGLLYAPVAMTILLAPILVRAAVDRRSRLVAVGWMVVGLAVLMAPYVSYLHSNTGTWELTAKTSNRSMEAWKEGAAHDTKGRDALEYALAGDGVSFRTDQASLTELIREDPAGYRSVMEINLEHLVDAIARPIQREHVAWGWTLLPLPLSGLAAWGAWRLRRRAGVWLLLTALFLPTATALVFFVQPRYLIPATGFVCVLAGMAFAELRGTVARIATGMAAVLLVWSLLAAADGSEGFLNRREAVELRLAGQWIEEHTPSDARVMTRSMVLEYYADRRAVAIPYASPEEVLAFAAHHGVDYIVADSFTYRDLRPQLISWAHGRVPEGYSIVYRHQRDSRNVIVLKADTVARDRPADSPGLGFVGDG